MNRKVRRRSEDECTIRSSGSTSAAWAQHFGRACGHCGGYRPFLGNGLGLRVTGLVPAQNEPWPNQLLLLAAVYRSMYGVISGYVIARLAPNRPMGHSLVAGALGMLVSTLGAIAAWSTTVGQHWYAVSLVLTAIPMAWIGARLRLMQFRIETAAAPAKADDP